MVDAEEVKDRVKTDLEKSIDKNASISEQLFQATTTPYPAWIFSGLLLSTPLVSKQIVLEKAGAGGLLSANKVRIGPSNLNSLFFGAALGLGGWIINDGDVADGSGFITAWSALYLIVNGKSTFNGLRYGKVWPVGLSIAALTNGYIHGKRFFFTQG